MRESEATRDGDRARACDDRASSRSSGSATSGRKAELTAILRGIAELPADERGPVGKAGNEARQELESLLGVSGARSSTRSELGTRLAEDAIDVTLPGAPPAPAGAQNPLIRTQREIEDIFVGLGYRVMEGPEVELDYYNFTALNHPPGHPARMAQDTFYVDPSDPPGRPADPLERRGAAAGARGRRAPHPHLADAGPLDGVPAAADLHRRARAAATAPTPSTPPTARSSTRSRASRSAPDITLADLKGTLDEFARAIFGPERETRFRPGFFPFTEPSVEVDVSCFRCGGSGKLPDGSRDPLCKGIGWIEILGAGMVDPNVYGFVAENGYDPERIQGFAFGMGIERIAMLKYGVPDLRKFFENDVRVLEQFR